MTRSVLAKVSLILAAPLLTLVLAGCSESPTGADVQAAASRQPSFAMGRTITLTVGASMFDHLLPPSSCLQIEATWTKFGGNAYPRIDWRVYDDGIESSSGSVDAPAHATGSTESVLFNVDPASSTAQVRVDADLYRVSNKDGSETLMASGSTGNMGPFATCIG